MTSRESEDLAPLDADIASLLASEKPIAVHDVEHVAAAFAATRTAIAGLGAAGGGGGGDTGGGAATAGSPIATGASVMGTKAIATAALTFVLGTVVGGVAVYSTMAQPETRAPSASGPAPAVERATIPPSASASASASEAAPLSVMELPTAKPVGSVAKIAAPEPDALGDGARGLAAERALLDVARAGLARGAPNETLDATSRHARDYAQGVLAEEREALAIKALVATARVSEARARAARFKARFPKSLLLPAIEGAIRADDAG